ncbi:MAG TPA: hypothetical protein VGH28_25345 [Polyangiaceae bacterium]|jgi:hypothetical protein
MRFAFCALVVVAAACEPQDQGCPNGILVLSTNEQNSTQTGVLPLDGTPAVMVDATMFGGGDPVLATSAGRHFLINRDQNIDMVYELDSCGHGIAQGIWSTRAYGETAWSDPQDVAADPIGRLWVARFLTPSVLIKGQTDTTIDLSHLDPDGNPDMSSIRIVGTQAFVALERLSPASSGFVSTQKSEIAVIDTASLALVQTITLAGRNPLGLMSESPGKLWLADAGDPQLQNANEPDAGIEVVDTASLTSTLLIPETTLGASAIEVAVSATCGAAILADATPGVNHTSLVSFSLDGSNLATAIAPTPDFDLRGLAWLPDGRLLVGDRQSKTGGFPVHVLTPSASCALTAGPDLTVPDLPALAFAP